MDYRKTTSKKTSSVSLPPVSGTSKPSTAPTKKTSAFAVRPKLKQENNDVEISFGVSSKSFGIFFHVVLN
jgi:hypothetical protein